MAKIKTFIQIKFVTDDRHVIHKVYEGGLQITRGFDVLDTKYTGIDRLNRHEARADAHNLERELQTMNNAEAA